MSRKRPKHKSHEEHEHKERHEKKMDQDAKNKKKAEKERFLKRVFGENKKSLALVAGVFFVIGVVVSMGLGLMGSPLTGMLVDKETVGAKAIDYINNNLVQPGSSVTLVSVEENNGLYLITTSYQGNDIPVYVTPDGNFLFVQEPFDMSQSLQPPEQPPEQPPAETAGVVESCNDQDIVKTEKPVLMAWVVSMCPFGTQAMNGMYYVADHIGDEVDVVVRYITDVDGSGNPTAMHGEDEQNENQRQTCLREEQPDKFWDYIHCYVETGDAATCETTAGVDSDALNDCFENRGKDYMLQEAEDWATIYQPAGGRGSPSFFLNGVKLNEYAFDQNGRSPNNLKNIACCAMETPVDGCNDQLYTANPPRGYGVISTDDTPSAPSNPGSC